MAASAPTAAPAAPSTVDSQAKTNAILAWVFAPFTSFAWKDNTNEFVKSHARSSLYLGIANVAIWLVLFVVGIVVNTIFYSSYAGFGIGSLLSCGLGLLNLANWVFVVVPRIIGIIKANNGETWDVPVLNDFMKKFIKL